MNGDRTVADRLLNGLKSSVRSHLNLQLPRKYDFNFCSPPSKGKAPYPAIDKMNRRGKVR